MKARATLASVLVLLALTAALVGIVASPAFAANCGNGQGGALLLGCHDNTSTDETNVTTSGSLGFRVHATGVGSAGIVGLGGSTGVSGGGDTYGVQGTGLTGVYGFGSSIGIEGRAPTGVYGLGTSSGVEGSNEEGFAANGVYGHVDTPGTSGVYGLNVGTGYGVAGRASNVDGGTGVYGEAPNSAVGIGVLAASGPGTALKVDGKAVFSRSGIETIQAGHDFRTVTLAGVTTASMILATSQQNKGVYVKAAVPGTGSFTIRLTSNAPSGGLKVAYFVLN
jgi:hypothetical protein